MNGGEVISSGGYGCIFRPSLKCKSTIKSKSEKNNKYISKLLFNKHADEEISEINRIKPIITKIPNNGDYFLLKDINYCQPDTLSKSDLNNLEKCDKFFEKNNFDKNNLNNELDKFTIINLPYGGSDLEKYIYSDKFTFTNFVTVNNSIINLLNNALLPMNRLNLIHMDLKDQNMLYQNNSLKIIDWGLSFVKTTNNFEYKSENFNNNLYRRPLQFNLPYSILLLNDDFWKEFVNYFNYFHIIEKKEINSTFFRNILRQILYNFFENIKYGHNLDLTNSIIPLFYDDENLDNDNKKFNKFIDVFTKIYTSIFDKYFDIKNKKFKINEYIENIYLYNCDIFGLLSVYISIYEKLKRENNKNVDLSKLKMFVKKYMFEEKFYIEPYNIQELNEDLNELNKFIFVKGEKRKIASGNNIKNNKTKINKSQPNKSNNKKTKKAK